MLYLNLAFDHELSLGGVSTTYDKNLFAPTRALLDLADDLDVPVTLFTDVLGGLQFRQWDADGFARPYERQLRDAAARGHDVQLHLHPHWLETTPDNGRFRASDKYSLHDFRDAGEWGGIDGIVRRGSDFLREVVTPALPGYEVLAFRAGGLVIQPSLDAIATALEDQGILFDSSFAPGYRFESDVSGVEFAADVETPNWMLGDSRVLEVPIATAPRTPWNNVPALVRRVLRRGEAPQSGGFPLYDWTAGVGEKLKRLLPRSAWFLSFDLYWADGRYLAAILDKHIANVGGRDGDVFVSTLSHPKSMGQGGLRVMGEFVHEVRSRYGGELSFVSFPHIAEQRGATGQAAQVNSP